jgi:hypothetical protein
VTFFRFTVRTGLARFVLWRWNSLSDMVTVAFGVRAVMRRAFILGLVVVVGCRRADADGSGGKRLVLESLYQLPVPDTATVVGGVVGSTQRLAVWGPHKLWLFDMSSSSPRSTEIALRKAVILAVEIGSTGVMALLSTGQNAVTLARVWPDDARLSHWTLPVSPEVGRSCQDRWHVGGRDRTGFFHVYRLSPEGSRVIWSATHASASLVPYFLSCIRSGIAVTEVAPPFETIGIGSLSAAWSVQPHLDSTYFGTAELPRWVSSPVFPLGEETLQVLADLHTDQRLLLLHDQTGRELRRRRLDAPFGVLASHERVPLLLATRRMSGMQVIVYKWRWAETEH